MVVEFARYAWTLPGGQGPATECSLGCWARARSGAGAPGKRRCGEGTNLRRGQTGLWGYLGDENRGGGGGGGGVTFVRKRRGRRTPPARTLSPVQVVAYRRPTEYLPSMGRPASYLTLSVCASCDFQAILCVRLSCISGYFGKMGRNGLGAAQIKPPHPPGA